VSEPAITLSPLDKVYVKIPVTAKLADGSTATITGVDVAVVPRRSEISAATTWTASSYANGTATVLVAGPAADPTGALPIPATGADVWIRVTDSPEVQAVQVGSVLVS
jgi:hypothetical protein